MAFENIQINNTNFTIDVNTGSSFYSIDHTTNKMVEKNSSGSVLFSYFMDSNTGKVESLQHDGVFFWTMEKSGSSGFIIKKWKVATSSLLELQNSFSYNSDAVNNYQASSFAVEWYADSLASPAISSDTSISVTNGANIFPGDSLVIGPSTVSASLGATATVLVTNKVGTTVTITPAVGAQFNSSDPIHTTKSFFVFSNEAPANKDVAALYKYDPVVGSLISVNSSDLFYGVTASTFFKDNLMFIKGGAVVWMDPVSQQLNKLQAIDILTLNRADYLTTFGMTGFGDTIYRLANKKVTLVGNSYTEDTWTEYNYTTHTTLPFVYMVAVSSYPAIVHKAVTGLTPTSDITVSAFDQYTTPVFNKSVSLVSTGGSLLPTTGVTDSEGKFTSVYTASSTAGSVAVQATVV